jgi:hypothetical protein
MKYRQGRAVCSVCGNLHTRECEDVILKLKYLLVGRLGRGQGGLCP